MGHVNYLSTKLNTNNKGFSIVELIVCVAILSIASMPILRSFNIAIKTNVKAQSMQNATSLAEGVMEEIKGHSITELETIYSSAAGEGNDSADIVKKTSNSNSYVRGKLPSGKDGVVIKEADGVYIFYKKDAVADSGEKFDVVASIDAKSVYNVEQEPTGTPIPDASDANSKELPVLERLDTGKNAAISTEINKYDESAIPTLIDMFYDLERDDYVSADPDISVSNRYKKITVTVNENTTKTKVNCDVTYSATISKGSNSHDLDFTKNIYSAEYDSYPGIYIFYKTMLNYVDLNEISLSEEAYLIPKEEIVFSGISDCRSYLCMNNEYIDDGTGKKFVYTSSITPAKSSELIVTDGPTEMRTYIGGDEHIYDTKKEDYIYDVNVMVTKSDGTNDEVRAFITSTKDVK